jgi:hypothetical protein
MKRLALFFYNPQAEKKKPHAAPTNGQRMIDKHPLNNWNRLVLNHITWLWTALFIAYVVQVIFVFVIRYIALGLSH